MDEGILEGLCVCNDKIIKKGRQLLCHHFSESIVFELAQDHSCLSVFYSPLYYYSPDESPTMQEKKINYHQS